MINTVMMVRIIRDTILIACLIYISVIDIKKYEVPNKALLISLAAWIITAPFLWDKGTPFKWTLKYVLAGLAVGVFMLLLSLVLDRLLKKETLGGGDIRLFALMGLYTGGAGAYITVLLACAIGLLTALIFKKRIIPFAPAIAAAGITALYAGAPITDWYLSLFGF